MDEVTDSASLLKLWVWVETKRKQVAWGAAIVALLALVIWFLMWRHGEQEIKAGDALSDILVTQMLSGGGMRPEAAPALLNVAADYPGYDAGAQATILAAGDLFAEGKYDQAKAQFEKFVREYRSSPLLTSALLGMATCLDAEHKPNEAKTAFKSLIDQHPNDPAALQARFSLARIYAAQNMPELARNYFEDVARARGSMLSTEAAFLLEELIQKHPELAPPAPPPATATPEQTLGAEINAKIRAATNSAPPKAPAPAPAKAPAASPAKTPGKSDQK